MKPWQNNGTHKNTECKALSDNITVANNSTDLYCFHPQLKKTCIVCFWSMIIKNNRDIMVFRNTYNGSRQY